MSLSLLRADRLASVYLFHPLQRLLKRDMGIPILMYHRVPEVDDCTGHPYYCTSTVVPVFERQMRYLRENGYRSVSVGEAYSAAQSFPTEKLVTITFDDGYRDFYTNAFRILNKYGFSATVFLPTAFIGDSPVRFKGVDCMTWSEIRELRRSGIEFGSHTVTHPQLRDVSAKQLRDEVADSRQHVEQGTGAPITSFSYPYAFPEADRAFVARLQVTLQECGYRESVSTIIGRLSNTANRFCMRRLPVNSHDDERFFAVKLEGGYDWLRTGQYASKLAKVSNSHGKHCPRNTEILFHGRRNE